MSEKTPVRNTLYYTPPARWSADHWTSGSAPDSASSVDNKYPIATLFERFHDEILLVGTFDTKAKELGILKERLLLQGLRVKTVDLSTSGKPSSADIPPHHIAGWHPDDRSSVFTNSQASAVCAMATAFECWIKATKGVAGIISTAGPNGTAMVIPAMHCLPFELPKVLISAATADKVGGDHYLPDVMLISSISERSEGEKISDWSLACGADAITGPAVFPPSIRRHSVVGISSSAATTPAARQIASLLLQHQHESVAIEANRVGGTSLQQLPHRGHLAGVIDLTTADVCDQLINEPGTKTMDRFGAYIESARPYIGSVGGLDIVRWHTPESVPEAFAQRVFWHQSPNVTLMRTSALECERLGIWIAECLNQMTGPVRFLLPLRGISALDAPGQVFFNPVANRILFDAVRKVFQPTGDRALIEIDCHINDSIFANTAVQAWREINH